MMPGGENKQSLGYTIIEVMIVLAVSSLMFLIAAVFINGKEEKASFVSGVNSMASSIQGIIEQVTDGQYSDVPLTCQADITGSISFSAVGALQGTNSGCVFRGKVIHFYTNSSGGPVNQYEVVSLADSRQNAITGLSPTIKGVPNLTTQSPIPQNLNLKDAASVTGDSYNLAIVQSGGQSNGGTFLSGSQTIFLAKAAGLTPSSILGNEASLTGTSMTTEPSSVICLTDGTQYAEILVGQDAGNTSSALAVSVQMKGTTPCS